MKARYLCDLDMAASIQQNLDFLDRCMADIKAKRKRLLELEKNKPSKRQLDIEDEDAKADN